MEEAIKYALISAAVIGALAFMKKGAKKDGHLQADGRTLLRLNKLYFYMGIICFLIGIASISLAPLSNDDESWKYGLLLSIMFIPMGLVCYFAYKNNWVSYDTTSIQESSFFGKKSEVLWKDVVSVKFSPLSGKLQFKDEQGRKVGVHFHSVGVSKFLQEMEAQTKWKKEDFPQFNNL